MKKQNRAIALLLCLCLLLGMLPTTSFALGGLTYDVEITLNDYEVTNNWSDIKKKVEDATSNQTVLITVSGDVNLPEPLRNTHGASFHIVGEGNQPTVSFEEGDKEIEKKFKDAHFLTFENGTGDSKLYIQNLTLNGRNKTGLVSVSGYGEVWFGSEDKVPSSTANVTFQKGYTGMEKAGSVRLEEVTHAVLRNCRFEENNGNLNSPNTGCLYYSKQGELADPGGYSTGLYIDACQFVKNEAHSGGAMYVYGKSAYAYVGPDCVFTDNHATQRGGAIHCHGTVNVDNSLFTGNHSDGLGGTFYVSASQTNNHANPGEWDNYYGVLVLSGRPDGDEQGFTKHPDSGLWITGSHAGTAGGAAYIAKDATVMLMGELHISGNTVDNRASNLYTASTDGHIVCTERFVECAVKGGVGISTSSPQIGQNIVISPGNLTAEYGWNTLQDKYPNYYLALAKLNGEGQELFLEEAAKYNIATDSNSAKEDIPGFFSYDGALMAIEHNPDDKGKLMLKYDVPAGKFAVVFDFNVPGTQAIVEVGDKGETRSLPTISTIPKEEVTYIFKGWYDAAENGNPAPNPVTIGEEIKVYYAQWDLHVPKPDPEPSPVPGVGKMYLVYFDQNYDGGGFTASYNVAGDFSFTVTYSFKKPDGTTESGSRVISVEIPWGWPGKPRREGHQFLGWSTSASGGSVVNTSTWTPTNSVTTLYAQWMVYNYTLTWNAKGGQGGGTTNQDYGTTVAPPANQPTRPGYEFTGWYLDEKCSIPLTSGTLVTGAATFYAGWTPKEYTITWDAGYTGGAITTVKQYHDEALNILPRPQRNGYTFTGWYKGSTKAENYGKVREDVTFTARWDTDVQDYRVDVEWDDQSNNDNVRPESITVALLANGIPTGDSFTLREPNPNKTTNVWTDTFRDLPVTDVVSNPITYSVAITSPVSDEYSYGIENKSAELGYILLTHTLITRDVDTYVVWDDDSNNDGFRPATVSLQLYANGSPVDDGEAKVALSGNGDTWFYQFRDVQKYYSTATQKGLEIQYTLKATATNPGELAKYEVEYQDYSVILRHRKDTVSRTVQVEWQDNNDQDGKRPASMSVQLYADNVPMEGKTVVLSEGNGWTYTWDNLPKYADSGRDVAYSARVTSTLVDYVAKSTGMTIEMTYVPSSTSISAFVTWTDEANADGLRPDYITAQLIADGKPTGDKQVLSATNGWTMTWNNYPIYKDGDRIEYTFQVDVPSGYEVEYNGVYDTSGLSAILTHSRLLQDLTGNIVWEDRNNQSGGRMSQVAVLLYADGSVINEDDKVWISAADGWEHTFLNLPIYRDGGEEIKYSMMLVSDPGKYVATTSKMTITMQLEPEYVDVPFQIIWDDNNNSDSARPGYVAVTLLVDGKPSQYGQTATAQSGWAVTFAHLDRFGANGQYLYTAQLVLVPEGYTANYTSPGVVVLKRVAEKKNVTATVMWYDNDDQYGERPGQVTLTLYADRLDGNGPQNTGRVEKCRASEGWEYTFEDVPAHFNGKNIIYSVVASGNLPNYSITYDGMDVFMRHAGYTPGVHVNYTANLVWHDGHNAKGSRPYNILVTLYANGEEKASQTLTESNLDDTGYTWTYTFEKLPAKMDGKDVIYTIGITEPTHYTTRTEGNTITLTHVQDLPILLRWADDHNNDGVRPASLTLELFGDAVRTDTTLTVTGNSTAETWRDVFAQIPVWSEALLDHEIVYTWAFAGDDLAEKGYGVDYNGFTAAVVAEESVYPIDLSRVGEVENVSATLVWDDENDQDGLRRGPRTVKLYADGVDTGKSLTLTGTNVEKSWRGSFESLPVWRNGTRIQYSIQVDALSGYTATSTPGDPLTVTMLHTPAVEEITATVIWADSTNKGGLTRFPVEVELLVDGVASGETRIIESPNTSASWGEKHRYHDHGTAFNYTVKVSDTTLAAKPDEYDITVDGRTVTVSRARFRLDGRVLNYADTPIPGTVVSIYNSETSEMEKVEADENGYFAFTVTPGSHVITGEAVSGGYLSGNTQVSITNDDVTKDIRLQWGSGITIIGKVTDSNGNVASHARIVFELFDVGISGVVSADENGDFQINNIPKGTYQFRAYYTYGDKVYLSETFYVGPYDSNPLYRNIVVAIPKAGAQLSSVSGTVESMTGKPVAGVVVICTGSVKYLNPSTVVEATTNERGEFTLYGLPEDTYTLLFKNQNRQILNAAGDVSFAAPREKLLDIVILNGAAPASSGTLAGVALDKSGMPVEGAQVIVTDRAAGALSTVLVTNANGAFDVKLPAGEYTVELWKPFENTTENSIPANDQTADQPGSHVTADGFTISGVILDADGQPGKGVTVYLYGEDGMALEANALQVVETGQEETTPVEESSCFTEADLSEIEDDGADLSDTEPAEAEAEEIASEAEPVEGKVDEVDPDTDPVEGEPAEDSFTSDESDEDEPAESGVTEEDPDKEERGIALQSDDEELTARSGYIRMDEYVTAVDGKYIFAALAAGRYVVKIAGGIGGNGGSEDIPVEVKPGAETPDDANLTVTTDSYTISGVAEDKNGTPVNCAEVTLLDEEGKEVAHLTTAEDGAYEFEALPKGDYTVSITYPDSEALASGQVTIENGGFAVFPGCAVSGAVKDNKGNTLSDAAVTFSGKAGIYTATTDKSGIYHVAVPDGKYTVVASYQGKTAEKAVTVKGQSTKADLTITLSTGETTDPGGNSSGGTVGGGTGGGGPVGGGPIGDVQIPVETKTFDLSCIVTDKDGSPVVGAKVTAVNTKTGETYTGVTDSEGKYTLTLPKGEYTVIVAYGSTSTNPKRVSVSDNTTLETLTVDNMGTLVRGYIKGYVDGTFGGGDLITRSQVAALVSRVSADFDAEQTYALDFLDVPETAWYITNLGYCVKVGLIQGRGDGVFDPFAKITRSEFAAIVARFLGLPNEVKENPYTDIMDNWAAGYICQLTAKGIVEGKGDGLFDPDALISRYEAVTMLNRALERAPDEAVLDALISNRTIQVFPDLDNAHWAYYQVLEAAFDHYHK